MRLEKKHRLALSQTHGPTNRNDFLTQISMRHPYFIRLAPCLAWVAATSVGVSAAQKSHPAKTLLEQGVRDAVHILEKERPGTPSGVLAKKVRPVGEKIFNFESITRKALAQGWRELSPEQQKQATSLLSEILIRKYAGYFVFDEKPQLTFSDPLDLGGGKLEIPSVTVSGGHSFSVLYRLETYESSWRIYDVSIEGVSLVANYRAQFESVRQKNPGHPEALIKAMKDNLQP
jgi:phospholipid transport system substrate-binding protein